MSKLSFKKEQILVLASADLDQVQGGMGPVSSALHPTATAVSSAKPGGGGFAHPTATAVSSARPPHGGGHGPVSSALKPTATAVSSARPPQHHSLSSVMPRWGH